MKMSFKRFNEFYSAIVPFNKNAIACINLEKKIIASSENANHFDQSQVMPDDMDIRTTFLSQENFGNNVTAIIKKHDSSAVWMMQVKGTRTWDNIEATLPYLHLINPKEKVANINDFVLNKNDVVDIAIIGYYPWLNNELSSLLKETLNCQIDKIEHVSIPNEFYINDGAFSPVHEPTDSAEIYTVNVYADGRWESDEKLQDYSVAYKVDSDTLVLSGADKRGQILRFKVDNLMEKLAKHLPPTSEKINDDEWRYTRFLGDKSNPPTDFEICIALLNPSKKQNALAPIANNNDTMPQVLTTSTSKQETKPKVQTRKQKQAAPIFSNYDLEATISAAEMANSAFGKETNIAKVQWQKYKIVVPFSSNENNSLLDLETSSSTAEIDSSISEQEIITPEVPLQQQNVLNKENTSVLESEAKVTTPESSSANQEATPKLQLQQHKKARLFNSHNSFLLFDSEATISAAEMANSAFGQETNIAKSQLRK